MVAFGVSCSRHNARVFSDPRNEVAGLVPVESAHEGQWHELPIEVREFRNDGLPSGVASNPIPSLQCLTEHLDILHMMAIYVEV